MKKIAALIGSLILASPAYAIPPVLPPGAQEFVQSYIRADTSNDLSAYADLFSPDAKITTGTMAPLSKDQWVKALSAEFNPNRHARFLDILADGRMAEGKPVLRIAFVEAVKLCRPNLVECFPTYRTETATVKNGQIVALERSEGASRRFTPEGAWMNFE